MSQHGNIMATAWQLQGNCMATAWQLHGNCMATAWQPMANAWQLPAGGAEPQRRGDRLLREFRPPAPLHDGQGLRPRPEKSLRASTPQGSRCVPRRRRVATAEAPAQGVVGGGGTRWTRPWGGCPLATRDGDQHNNTTATALPFCQFNASCGKPTLLHSGLDKGRFSL